MNYKYHGLMSMLLFSIAVFIAMAAMWPDEHRWWWIAGYALVNIISSVGVAWNYCAKCACRPGNCSHIVIGMLADYLPVRPQVPYTLGDYLGMAFSVGIVFLYPLYWLLQDWRFLIAFLAVGALAGLEIFLAVCTHCVNHRCLACKWQQRYLKKS